ncbi:MAG: hypothetical protein KKH98_08240 [Spirochaetes bacterium]|nr:hypothetical protein [Spirochaetota bacterium]
MNLYKLIVPLGIFTYLSLLVNVIIGRFHVKLKMKSWMKWHKFFGFFTLILATIHAVLVIVLS